MAIVSVADWLDRLIAATPDERRAVSLDGLDVGLGVRRVRCLRCNVPLNWTSAFEHLRRTEAYPSDRPVHLQLHQPGDLVDAGEPVHHSTCRTCRRPIVWASTSTGGTVPVDPVPTADGRVVLVWPAPGDRAARPLAMFLTPDTAAPASSRHALHTQTCSTTRRRRHTR